MSQQIGFAAEDHAQKFLTAQGLTFVQKNYHCKCGEIDLIMKDKSHLVFIEVRARSSQSYGGAIGSITLQKRRKIIKSALVFLTARQSLYKCSVRFDVITLQGNPPEISWFQDAFGAGDYG